MALGWVWGLHGMACGGDSAGQDASGTVDATAHIDGAPTTDGNTVDGAGPTDAAPIDGGLSDLSRGLQWVRSHPMFVSGLKVVVDPPSEAQVSLYFDDFNATSVHTWETGLPDRILGWAAPSHPKFRWLSWVHLDGTSWDNHEILGGLDALTLPAGRIGYQIGDEPRSLAEIMEFQAGVNAVRAADPEGLIIINFTLHAEDVDQIMEYAALTLEADVLSYDHYTRGNSSYESLARCRAAALLYGLPYWRYMKSYYDSDDEPLTESDMRWNAFSGLVYGYTGHTWFIYQVVSTDPDLQPAFYQDGSGWGAAPTALWAIGAQINRELTHLGRGVTQLTSTAVCYLPWTDILPTPDGTEQCTAGMNGKDPYFVSVSTETAAWSQEALLGFFQDTDGQHYIMVQNVNHTNGTWPIGNSSSATITLQFDFSGAPPTVARNSVRTLNKLTGNVEDRAMDSVTGDEARLDIDLAAGDVFFFKYDTGAPFALGPAW